MDYIFTLILTIIIEFAVVYMLKYASARMFWTVVLVNVLTNPTLNYIVARFRPEMWQQIILELVVITIEALIIKVMVGKKIPAFGLSFVMNAVSFLVGLYLPWDLIGKYI